MTQCPQHQCVRKTLGLSQAAVLRLRAAALATTAAVWTAVRPFGSLAPSVRMRQVRAAWTAAVLRLRAAAAAAVTAAVCTAARLYGSLVAFVRVPQPSAAAPAVAAAAVTAAAAT